MPHLLIDLPIQKGRQIGNLKVNINGQEKQSMQLQSGDKISRQYIFEDLKTGMEHQTKEYHYFTYFILLFNFYIYNC